MSLNANLPDAIALPTVYEDGVTTYAGRDIERVHGLANAQTPFSLGIAGFGVRAGVGSGMAVTPAMGLTLNVGSGAAVVGGVGEGLGCGIQLAEPFVRGGVPASRGNANPVYLFAKFDPGDYTQTQGGGIVRPDSFETRQGLYVFGDTPTVAGWVNLATITTSSNAILTCVPNPNRFLKLGGDVAPATTAALGTVKMSVAPAVPASPVAVGDNDPRNSNARTPTAHKSTHATGGTDALTPADIGAATAAALSGHTGNAGNPHATTKFQVGLGNADNTSDADKPVSTAQATALTGKLAKTANLSDLTDAPTARTNLGLGSAATKTAGSAVGNVPLNGAALGASQTVQTNGVGALVTVPKAPVIASTTISATIADGIDVIEANGGASNLTITLPATFTGKFGRLTIKQLGTGTITLAAAAGTTLESAKTFSTQYSSLDYYLSDTVWRLV